jgi:hypothetical protein
MKASVFEKVSMFGRFSRANESWIVYFRAAFEDRPMPFLIVWRAASSMSLIPPFEMPVDPTAP